MLSTLAVILPVFALVFVGWLARRTGVLGQGATSELNRFVVYLALPALLFDIMASASWQEIWQPGFIAAFGLGALAVFILTIIVRLRGKRQLADAAIDGLNAGYGNTGFIGFPLAAMVFGGAALTPTLIATILTVCVIFALGIVLIEVGLQTRTHRRHLAIAVGRQLLRNPLVVAPIIGALIPLADVTIPLPAANVLDLLGGAAAPCALVTLGLFLAEKNDAAQADIATVSALAGMKLLAQPAITWFLAVHVFELTPLQTNTAVLISALPTGTGPFMLAELYQREVAVTSKVILTTTVLSIITISGYLTTIA